MVRIPACQQTAVRRWPGFDSPIESTFLLPFWQLFFFFFFFFPPSPSFLSLLTCLFRFLFFIPTGSFWSSLLFRIFPPRLYSRSCSSMLASFSFLIFPWHTKFQSAIAKYFLTYLNRYFDREDHARTSLGDDGHQHAILERPRIVVAPRLIVGAVAPYPHGRYESIICFVTCAHIHIQTHYQL